MGRNPFRWPTVINEVKSSWNVMAHGDAREGKWRGNWRREWVASTLHTTSEHGVASIATAHAHTSAASRLNWRPRRFKWTRPFLRKTKSGFRAFAITFQMQSTAYALRRLHSPVYGLGLAHDMLSCYLQPLFYNKMSTQSTTIQQIKYLAI